MSFARDAILRDEGKLYLGRPQSRSHEDMATYLLTCDSAMMPTVVEALHRQLNPPRHEPLGIVFDELREGIKDIERLSGLATGEVRIACPEFLAAGLMTDAIDGFSQAYPDIVCHVVEADVSTLEFRQLQERGVDLMVTRVPNAFAADDLDVEVLFDDPHLIVAGEKSRWASKRAVKLADLADEPWIIPPSLIVNAILREAFAAQGLKVPAAQVTTSFILMRNHLLASGRFLTVLPESALRSVLAAALQQQFSFLMDSLVATSPRRFGRRSSLSSRRSLLLRSGSLRQSSLLKSQRLTAMESALG